MGHEALLTPPRLNGRCGFRQRFMVLMIWAHRLLGQALIGLL
jgi:hypothetical protein